MFLKKAKHDQVYQPLERVSEAEDKLLGGSDDDESVVGLAHPQEKARHCIYLFHLILFVIYTTIFIVVVALPKWQAERRSSPPNAEVVFDGFLQTEIDRYFGTPHEEIETNWDELLQYENVKAPPSLLEDGQLESAVELPGGGYFATLWMHHNLRCLRSIHRYIYQDHYSPDATEEKKQLGLLHTGHCLDALRQSVQCHGDMSLLVMQWTNISRHPLVNPTAYSQHQCKSWDYIQEWGRSHSYDVMAPGVLVHPTLGPSYPDGELGVGLQLVPGNHE